jgi:hypothetical protein
VLACIRRVCLVCSTSSLFVSPISLSAYIARFLQVKGKEMQYFLFGGSADYPAGGADDFIGVFPSIEAAKTHFDVHQQEWAHIARFEDNQLKIVCAFGTSYLLGREDVADWHDCKD